MATQYERPGGSNQSEALEEILESPMVVREFDNALAGHLTRAQRREFWRALQAANLIVFHA